MPLTSKGDFVFSSSSYCLSHWRALVGKWPISPVPAVIFLPIYFWVSLGSCMQLSYAVFVVYEDSYSSAPAACIADPLEMREQACNKTPKPSCLCPRLCLAKICLVQGYGHCLSHGQYSLWDLSTSLEVKSLNSCWRFLTYSSKSCRESSHQEIGELQLLAERLHSF